MKNNFFPKIKFKDSKSEWIKVSLSDLIKFSNGINAPKESYGSGRKMISVMDILSEERIVYEKIRNSVKVSENVENKNKVENGDLIFVRSSEVRNEVGWVKAYLQEQYALYSGFTIRGKKIKEYDAKFIECSLNFCNRHQIESKAGGSTRYNVGQEILKSVEIYMPSLEEQLRISKLIQNIENKIVLHQQELDALKQTKQGFLQKMFPSKGQTTPIIRFSEFNEEWKKIRLNEVATIVGGGTPDTKNNLFWNGEIDWYSPTEIGKNIYAYGSVRKISKLGLKKSSAKVLPAHQTILFTSRAGIGDMAILKKDGATNQGFQSLIVNDDCDIYFLYTLGKDIKEYALKNASGSTFLEISGKNLGKMPILVPSFEEQLKIGEFFRQLDEVIELKEQELEALKQTKQGFLQKMFV